MYIFQNNKILISLKLQQLFLMQNTRCYVFSHPLNVNSYNGNFTNYSEFSIRKTNLYCVNTICLNLTHALRGRRPVYFVTFSMKSKLPFEIFLFFCIFIYNKFWDTFSKKHVCQLFLYIKLLRVAKNYKLCNDSDAHLALCPSCTYSSCL